MGRLVTFSCVSRQKSLILLYKSYLLKNKTDEITDVMTQKTYIFIQYYPVYQNETFACKKFWTMRRYFDF